METEAIKIIKSSGERVNFSIEKLKRSLHKAGADSKTISQIIDKVRDELYQGISTKEIYNRAFALLKRKKGCMASKYKLKRAIYELGPTGFPFEHFIAAILKQSGYQTEINQILQGQCVTHEIDVIAQKNNETTVIECKFHSEEGLNCNVKIPLYIHSRYNDVKAHWEKTKKKKTQLTQGWVVTNTRFTQDAMQYSKCVGLYLLSWDFPKDDALKDRIDRLGLYPVTVSTLLTKREKQFLLSRNVVLYKSLIDDHFYLDHLGISEIRKEKIFNEIKSLCNA
ncbi:ATP cone domain-containing protein [Formosa sp. S-31]|uniref:ATP cone domain-containing protein n=1 Tax=Formosa sp. S-31 TaxID=2790949 RepID=UPI003EB6F1AD